MSTYDRAELNIDGNCGYALLGSNIQVGEAEFIEMPEPNNLVYQLWAPKMALLKLRERLNMPNLSYYFGSSHPYGG
jgi:hypothetical protein